MMNVVMVATEMAPFSKVGGLGDVMGALPKALARLGARVTVLIPHLPSMDPTRLGISSTGAAVRVFVGGTWHTAQVLESKKEDPVRVLLVSYPPFFHRAGLYGTRAGDHPDNAQRFAFFSYAALEAAKLLISDVDIVHSHDWQTGLVPFLLRVPEHYGTDRRFKGTATVHTIHNLSYQGLFPADLLPQLGISWSHFNLRELEFYGLINFLKTGLVSADVLTTVSPAYAREIQFPDYAWGLHGVLTQRADALHGIVNGIDTEAWDPETDPLIPARYSSKDLSARAGNTEALRRVFDLPDDGRPVVGLVNRLVAQKGIDLLLGLEHRIESVGLQWAILGEGDALFEGRVADELVGRHPTTVAARIGFDEQLARLIYAGSDFFCVPSYFEPCGLGQMIALRYGSLPVVRKTGGLTDTITDVEADDGVGIVFEKPDCPALEAALLRALKFSQNSRALNAARRRAMARDHSWEVSAKEYMDLYRGARDAGAR